MTGKRHSNDTVLPARRSEVDLGQKKAQVEKASQEELGHMESREAAELTRQQQAKKESRA